MRTIAHPPEPRQLDLFNHNFLTTDEASVVCPACDEITSALLCEHCHFPISEVLR